MRRFSQRSALVTLSEINITPLLDLAFVLLIIFVITTPLLEKGITVPKVGGAPDKILDPRDIQTVEVARKKAQLEYRLAGQVMSFPELEANLRKDAHRNPNLVVYIRADESAPWKDVAALMDLCQRNGIRMSARTQNPTR